MESSKTSKPAFRSPWAQYQKPKAPLIQPENDCRFAHAIREAEKLNPGGGHAVMVSCDCPNCVKYTL